MAEVLLAGEIYQYRSLEADRSVTIGVEQGHPPERGSDLLADGEG